MKIHMSEKTTISKKLLLIILIFAVINFVVGGIFLLLGLNLYFNELFYGNAITFAIFRAISYIGEDIVQILLLATLIFVYDVKFGRNVGFSLLGSYYFNGVLKDIFQDPRPWTNDYETGFGFPSGHSQNAVAVWGLMSYESYNKENKILQWLFIIFIYLIGISRIVVGVHDLEDVWGGFFFGTIFLVLFIYFEPLISEKAKSLNFLTKAILAIIIPIAMLTIAIIIFPTTTLDYGLCCGGLMGISLGYLIETEKIHYDPKVLNTKQKLVNLVIGLVLTMVFYFALSVYSSDFFVWRFTKYFILAFLVITLVPWIFTKIKRD